MLRVHDVREHRQLAESIAALRRYRRAAAPRRQVLARGIPCRCRVGVTAKERAKPQDLLVDVEVSLAPARLGARDDLDTTVDYAELAARAQAVAARDEYRLVETLAERIAVAITADAGPNAGSTAAPGRIESLRVCVSKPGAARELGVAEVGAGIDWRP